MNHIRTALCTRLAALGCEVEDFGALDLATKRAWEYLTNDLNLPEVPEALGSVWVDLAAGFFLADKQLQGDEGAAVKSITEGDISLTYQDGSSPGDRLRAEVARLMHPPENLLARYRRISW